MSSPHPAGDLPTKDIPTLEEGTTFADQPKATDRPTAQTTASLTAEQGTSKVTATESEAVYEEDLTPPTGTTTVKKTTSKILAKRPASPSGDAANNKRPKASGSLDGYFKRKEPSASRSSSPGGSGSSEPKDVIAELEKRTLGIDWREVLRSEFTKAYFVKLKTFISNEFKTQTVYPVAKDVYSWSRLTKLEAVKVVIIGQDPYHGPGQAHGLSFSVRDPVPPPPSLKNIYKQLSDDIPGFKIPKSGDLTPTARQGVLWLNTSLTVRSGQAASHASKGWETFTVAVLKAVIGRRSDKGIVFLAWGGHASKVCKSLGIDRTKHLVLESAHPSPLSAHRGFLGNQHFKKTNEWLDNTYGEGSGIDWTVLNPTE
ncbi:uracil DNA glycosylase [Tulasnella sp. 332]|nr:uracil DNA glycosylase [Tulasnella sp. 332]